jgi:hypothetical protein
MRFGWIVCLTGFACSGSFTRALGQSAGEPPLGPLVHMGPLHESGSSVTGAEEGWFRNPDGTFSILVGYFNRNKSEELDVPVGPNNRLEPGGPNQGQPTHFLPGRQWGLFTVVVPKDFGTRRLTWTLVANRQTTVIPLDIDPVFEVSPFKEESMGNTPPVVKFDPAGRALQGPSPDPLIATLKATASNPLPLTVWVADDAKAFPEATEVPKTPIVSVKWSKFRGPGPVTFSEATPRVQKTDSRIAEGSVFNGKATTTATFREPGDYVLVMVANDWSGDGGRGFQCCWTTIQVKVSVAP